MQQEPHQNCTWRVSACATHEAAAALSSAAANRAQGEWQKGTGAGGALGSHLQGLGLGGAGDGRLAGRKGPLIRGNGKRELEEGAR